MNGQGLTANQPPPRHPLTMDERQKLLDLIGAELGRVKPTTREGYNALIDLLIKIRGGYP
jgi:hypothetical protein